MKSTIDGSASGTHTMTFDQGDGTDNDTVEGGSLIVIYKDASAPASTIILKGGTSDPSGSTFDFTYPALTQSNLTHDLLMSVGISNSAQYDNRDGPGWYQASNITANNQAVSHIAGGCDDSTTFAANYCDYGGYNTIGGVGDTAGLLERLMATTLRMTGMLIMSSTVSTHFCR